MLRFEGMLRSGNKKPYDEGDETICAWTFIRRGLFQCLRHSHRFASYYTTRA